VGVWLLLVSRRPADPPPGAREPESPTAQIPERAPATPERRRATPPPPATPAVSPAAPTTGSLRVESQPTGARIFLDGEAIGHTPLVLTDVAPGEHQIGLDLDATRYRRWSSSVIVTAGHEEKLLAVMTPSTSRR
jgi:PEGA domain